MARHNVGARVSLAVVLLCSLCEISAADALLSGILEVCFGLEEALWRKSCPSWAPDCRDIEDKIIDRSASTVTMTTTSTTLSITSSTTSACGLEPCEVTTSAGDFGVSNMTKTNSSEANASEDEAEDDVRSPEERGNQCILIGCCQEPVTTDQCAPVVPSNPCVEVLDFEQSGEYIDTFDCAAAWKPAVLPVVRVQCCLCGVTPEFVDLDPNPGMVRGMVRFGPAMFADNGPLRGNDTEPYISEYHTYLVPSAAKSYGSMENWTLAGRVAARPRAPAANTTSHKDVIAAAGLCCNISTYSVMVEAKMPNPKGSYRILVAPVTAEGAVLPLGKLTTFVTDWDLSSLPRVSGALLVDVPNASAAADDPVLSKALGEALAYGLADVLGVPKEVVVASAIKRRPSGWGYDGRALKPTTTAPARRLQNDGQVVMEFDVIVQKAGFEEMVSQVAQLNVTDVTRSALRRYYSLPAASQEDPVYFEAHRGKLAGFLVSRAYHYIASTTTAPSAFRLAAPEVMAAEEFSVRSVLAWAGFGAAAGVVLCGLCCVAAQRRCVDFGVGRKGSTAAEDGQWGAAEEAESPEELGESEQARNFRLARERGLF